MTVRSGARAGLALVAMLLAPQASRAADSLVLTPRVELAQEFTDNVFYDEGDEKSDKITRITPSLRLAARSETGFSRLWVGMQVREHWRYSELDAVDPFVKGEFERELTPRWLIGGNGEYRKRHSTDAVSAGDGSDLYGSRPDIETRQLGGSMTRRLAPSVSLTAHGTYLDVDYDLGSSREVQRFNDYTDYGVRQVGLIWQRSLSPVQLIALDAGYSLIPFDSAESFGSTVRDSRDDHIYRLAARWTRSWTPRLVTTLEGGARYLRTDGGSVRGVQEFNSAGNLVAFDTEPDPSFAFVGEADLEYRTLHGQINLHLSRETQPNSGSRASQGSRDVDRVSLSLDRQFGRRLRLHAYGTYTHSSSSGKVVQPIDFFAWTGAGNSCGREGVQNKTQLVCLVDVDSELDEDFYTAGVELSWRLRRSWSTYISYGYRSYSDDLPNRRDWNVNRVTFGFRWSHDVPL